VPKTATAASPKALAWVQDAIARHGQGLDDGLVRIAVSQAALAAESGCSAGTIAYYLRCLGPAVVTRRGGIVINAATLASATTTARRRTTGPLATEPGSASESSSAFGAHVLIEAMGSLISTLVELGTKLVSLGTQLNEAIGTTHPRTDQRINPRTALASFAEIREEPWIFADPRVNNNTQESMKSFLSCLETREQLRASVRDVRARADRKPERPLVGRQVCLSNEEAITEAIAPLVAFCEAQGWPAVLDRAGKDWLGRYSPGELRRGVTNVLRELDGAIGKQRPLGLLVYKARHDEDFFVEPVLAPAPSEVVVQVSDEPEPPDEEAAAALATMDPDELANLDAAIRRQLRIGPLVEATFADPGALARQRQQVWRARQRITSSLVVSVQE
jgi:hypothetical protein